MITKYIYFLLLIYLPLSSLGQKQDVYFSEHNGSFVNHYSLKKNSQYWVGNNGNELLRVEYYGPNGKVIRADNYNDNGDFKSFTLYDCLDSKAYSAVTFVYDSILKRRIIIGIHGFDEKLTEIMDSDTSLAKFLVLSEKHVIMGDNKILVRSLNGHVYERDTVSKYTLDDILNHYNYIQKGDSLCSTKTGWPYYKIDEFFSLPDTLLHRKEVRPLKGSKSTSETTFYGYDDQKRLVREVTLGAQVKDTLQVLRHNYLIRNDSLIKTSELSENKISDLFSNSDKSVFVEDVLIYQEMIRYEGSKKRVTRRYYDSHGNLEKFILEIDGQNVSEFININEYYELKKGQ